MGKASRRKRGDVVPIINAKSAWAAVRRVQFRDRTFHADQMRLLASPSLRIVKVPLAQSKVSKDLDPGLLASTVQTPPPFEPTFFDFGFFPVIDRNTQNGLPADVELAGVLVHWDAEVERWVGLWFGRETRFNKWRGGAIDSVDALMETEYTDFLRIVWLLVSGALVLLGSANVDLVDGAGMPFGHQAHGIPHMEIVVRQGGKRYVYPDDHQVETRDWSHRWEVRGHFKHFRKGPVFERHPERRITTHIGDEFVRIWCPPHVKGPQDKPLVPKLRTVQESAA